MTDKPSRSMSLRKGASASSPAKTPKPTPPRLVLLAAGALLLSGLSAIGAGLSLFGLKDWLRTSSRDSLNDKVDDSFTKLGKTSFGKSRTDQLNSLHDQIKSVPAGGSPRLTSLQDKVTALKASATKSASDALGDIHNRLNDIKDIPHQVDLTPKSQLIATIVVFIAMTLVAFAAYRGRYWARWGVLGLWVLATFTGTLAGLVSIASIASDQPVAFKLPAFIAGVLFVVAVVLTNLRPSTEYFNRNRPVRPPAAGQRRGLFAPRQPVSPRTTPARGTTPRDKATQAAPDRGRSKQRADAVAKGADLARTRAKAASKSRRTGT